MTTENQAKLPLPFSLKDKSWKTTTCSALAAAGYALTYVPHTSPVGIAIFCLGIFFNGFFGRDNDKTSEQVGANTNANSNAQ